MSELIDQFAKLFRGRIDCYGSWTGGCIKQPLTLEQYRWHLMSDDPADWIGVYPLGKNMCSWGCIDIDGADFPAFFTVDGQPAFDARDHPSYDRKDPQWHDWDRMLDLATDLTVVLEAKGIWGHIERTKNGYHVWVFPEDKLVEAKTMRRALMAACTVLDYKPNEVNPKQEHLDSGPGNYVRLPYAGALAGHKQRRFIYGGESIDLETFLDLADTTPTHALEACAALWSPPQRAWTVDVDAGLEAEPTVRKVNALGYTIWRDGPLPGSDRSSTLAHLAHLCRESNLTVDEAFTVVRSADERHGRKFADREDGDERIAEMIERAFAT